MPLKGITGEGSRKIAGAFFVDIAKTQLIDNQKNNVFFIIVVFVVWLLKAPACGGLLHVRREKADVPWRLRHGSSAVGSGRL